MFKRLGEEDGGRGGKKPRRVESLEERVDRERAPIEAEVLRFLLAHGCNAGGRIIVNFGPLKVYLFAEMHKAYGEMYRTSRFSIPRPIMDAAFEAMRGDGWVTGANEVTKDVELMAEANAEFTRIVHCIQRLLRAARWATIFPATDCATAVGAPPVEKAVCHGRAGV